MNASLRKHHQSDDDFTRAIQQWLAGEVTGHLGSHMYTSDINDQRWVQGHSAPTYYFKADEKATLDLVVRDINIDVDSLIDLGPGGEASVLAKTLPLLNAVKAQEYLPVDLAPTLARSAVKIVHKQSGVSGHPIIADFFKPMSLRKPNSLLAFMGGTLANIETYADKNLLQKRLTDIFSDYAKVISYHGYMLVSFDANTNIQEIMECYNNAQLGRLITSCVDKAVDTSGFDYDVVWTGNNYQLATGLRSKRDQVVPFNGRQYSLEKGEFLPVLNSYRFPVEFVKEAASLAGWQHRRTWSATGRTQYLLFKLEP
ncbi:MAG: L-histidine N(alpha)-methyltransferase [Alphaproteobacteria bacterium]|nr:L-histidine N(alpha)-methyltransferase [Alphaproteobacteria bacterium]